MRRKLNSKTRKIKKGFTLVELLVVIAIISILVGLLFPAIQSVRESGRRTVCSNKLRQIGTALLNYESSFKRFPAGAELGTAHAWSSRILPFLEQGNLYDQIDFDQSWDSPSNLPTVANSLNDFTCPSSWKTYEGFTDYCGVSGSWIGVKRNGSRNGILFPLSPVHSAVSPSDITDGLSQTIMVAEGVAVTEKNYGYWGCGLNCFSHDDGGVNNRQGAFDEIASLHPSGAQVVFADASVHFISETTTKEILGALCTRGNSEIVDFDF